MFLSCFTDAKENRDVETCDTPGEFMQVNIVETICVWLTGPLTMPLEKIDPNRHKKHIMYEKAILLIYMRLKKELYGNLQEDLLFCKGLTGTLKYWCIELNSYDKCISKNM